MATAASLKAPKELIFEWEGKDKNGKIVRGEMRAGGEAVVNASLRRQGVLVTRVRKRCKQEHQGIRVRVGRQGPQRQTGSW